MAKPLLQPVSYPQFLADIVDLAAAVEAGGAAWAPDYLVGIGRGGLVPATYLSHRLAVPLLSIDLSAGLAAFGEAMLSPLAGLAREGRRLLLIDDINDSGGTIGWLLARLAGEVSCAVGAVRVGVLLDNVRSSARVDYRARTIDRATETGWFVFPWEAVAPPEREAADAAAHPIA